MDNKKTIAILIIAAVIVALLVYYFFLHKPAPQFFGVINQKSVTLSRSSASVTVTTGIFSGNSANIAISASSTGSYTATFQGNSHSFSSNTTFSSNAINSNVTNTLTISGFGSTYYLTINFIAYTVSVIVNGYTLTNSHPNTTLTNVSSLNITINSAPTQTYTVWREVKCAANGSIRILQSGSTHVVTNGSGSTTFTESAPQNSSCAATLTNVTISGPGMSTNFTIKVTNYNDVSFRVTIS